MITEVVAALIWDGGRFLICKRPPDKARGLLYEFVGGKVEPGETKEEALIRECREELGITITVGTQFCAVTHDYPDLTIRLTVFKRRDRGRCAETSRACRPQVDNAGGDCRI